MSSHHSPKRTLIEWLGSALAGGGIGALVGLLMRTPHAAHAAHAAPASSAQTPAHAAAHAPAIPPALIAPFALLLLAIALMPFIRPRWWHTHYPSVAFFLGAFVTGVFLVAFGAHGAHAMGHAALEYYQFIALVFGLFTVSGAVVINVEARGAPLANVCVLAAGGVIANVIGTTGASMLLIRPFMRMNAGRLRAWHIVFFIFIVSNCGGCLTPIGDPPLYLGFLRGVPFFWTLTHLWQEWAFVNALLLGLFFALDTLEARRGPKALPTIEIHPGAPGPASGPIDLSKRRGFPFSVRGGAGIAGLAVVVAAVFLDPMLNRFTGYHAFPLGPIVQIVAGVVVLLAADKSLYERNHFTWAPIKEVACLFAGIFLTMVPALAYLAAHGGQLGLRTPTHFFFLTGALSAALDNAPTYLTFLQVAFAKFGLTLDPPTVREFIVSTYTARAGTPEAFEIEGGRYLAAISLGAVFFGAMTYIGNGPNFMVKAIAESAGVKMPTFLGFLKYSMVLLLPVLIVAWLVFG